MVQCPGCGARFRPEGLPPAERANAVGECLAAFHQLTLSTLTLGDDEFVHQYAVDAWAAQHAGGPARPVSTFFALAGLYFALEHGFTGRQVQQAHVSMSRSDKQWPIFVSPDRDGETTILDVLGNENLLSRWMSDVWNSWSFEQPRVRSMADALLARAPRERRTE